MRVQTKVRTQRQLAFQEVLDKLLVNDSDAASRGVVSIGESAAEQYMGANRSKKSRTDAIECCPVVVVGELGGRWWLTRQMGQIVPSIARKRTKCCIAEIEHTRCLLQFRIEFALQISELVNV